ncbi:YegS/Rv2252/BmrU family lipid kinase [Sphingomicrobium lutaoense]|uniref:YegS/Rv2252/BmrU family lipid kinase n=1 Tax=Sphingomicrobium lutaoense TaxID=515949 RepID=A0A839YSK5_9SPHN|nr:YegS/Rv2252/BmrU family lipid kinase [Sphingomicrobium lutaoense]MBB3763271.1 YegS/Rv2252/BmrU family lipid kinase [Sphingomicrobium lutaoense]
MTANPSRDAILVVNAMSRRGAEQYEEARRLLEEAGVRLIESHAVENGDDLRPTVRKAVKKAGMVIVGGGDGTISSFIGEFEGEDCVLAVLPMGTANSFARSLGLPLELEDVARVIAKGESRAIDIGSINGETFANVAAIGLSPLIADTIPDALKRWLGIFGYIVWAIRIAFSFSAFRLTIESEGSRTVTHASEVRIANGSFHGGVELVEEAEMDDARITVDAVTGKSMWRLALNWILVLLHLKSQKRTMIEVEAPEFWIETDPPRDISIDGEIRASTPAKVEVVPQAVRVVVPA